MDVKKNWTWNTSMTVILLFNLKSTDFLIKSISVHFKKETKSALRNNNLSQSNNTVEGISEYPQDIC